MWSFSYTGRGCADEKNTAERERIRDEISKASESQIARLQRDDGEKVRKAAEPHIRAAKDFVLAEAYSSDGIMSIVAEGWVEPNGTAGVSLSVSISGAASGE